MSVIMGASNVQKAHIVIICLGAMNVNVKQVFSWMGTHVQV